MEQVEVYCFDFLGTVLNFEILFCFEILRNQKHCFTYTTFNANQVQQDLVTLFCFRSEKISRKEPNSSRQREGPY